MTTGGISNAFGRPSANRGSQVSAFAGASTKSWESAVEASGLLTLEVEKPSNRLTDVVMSSPLGPSLIMLRRKDGYDGTGDPNEASWSYPCQALGLLCDMRLHREASGSSHYGR